MSDIKIKSKVTVDNIGVTQDKEVSLPSEGKERSFKEVLKSKLEENIAKKDIDLQITENIQNKNIKSELVDNWLSQDNLNIKELQRKILVEIVNSISNEIIPTAQKQSVIELLYEYLQEDPYISQLYELLETYRKKTKEGS